MLKPALLIFLLLSASPAYSQEEIIGPDGYWAQGYESAVFDMEDPPELKEAWSEWSRRLHREILQRFQKRTHAEFRTKEILGTTSDFSVTREGEIANFRLTFRSKNERLNALVTDLINSLAGDPILCFPAGSNRIMVQKGVDLDLNNPFYEQMYGRRGKVYYIRRLKSTLLPNRLGL